LGFGARIAAARRHHFRGRRAWLIGAPRVNPAMLGVT
jgi:hypothetical protein